MLRNFLGSLIGISVFAAGLVLLAPCALAAKQGEADAIASLKQTLRQRFPEMRIIDVRPAGIGSLYEVFTGKSMVYADRTGEHVIYGEIIETSTKKHLTIDRLNERNAINFDMLPFDLAIKVVKGDGSRKVAVFTDPDCPFCRKLEEEIAMVGDLTVYIFLLPVKELHPNAEKHAKAIWCSADRAKTWSAWMLESREPPNASCADDPISSVAQLADKVNITGTPTLYFESGHRLSGTVPAAVLEKVLAENAAPKETPKRADTRADTSDAVALGRVEGKDGAGDSGLLGDCKAPASVEGVAGSCNAPIQ